MERSSPVKTRLKPLGRWSIQSLRTTTGLAPTGAAVGGRKRLTRSSRQTAFGTTPAPTRHRDDEPAAAAGCSMVLKPAPQTPLCSLLLAECVQQAGWPDGGLNVLPLSNDDASL